MCNEVSPSEIVVRPDTPAEVGRCLSFLTVALYRHGVLITTSNRQHIEQWVELIVRFFFYDTTTLQRHKTYKQIQRHHSHVFKNAEAVMGFERVIRNQWTDTMKTHEQQFRKDWSALSSLLRSASRRQRRNVPTTQLGGYPNVTRKALKGTGKLSGGSHRWVRAHRQKKTE